jgi:hypothetical protein
MSEVADLPLTMKTANFSFLSRQHNKFYSTLEKLRREGRLSQMIEEGRPWGKDLEAPPAFISTHHEESTRPLLQWRGQYTYIEKGYVDRKVEQATWQRRFRLAGHIALLVLSVMSVYIVIHIRAFKT